MLKFSNLRKPTPAFWKKLGITLSAISAFIGTCSFAASYPVLGGIGFAFGVISLIITNMTAVEDKKDTTMNDQNNI